MSNHNTYVILFSGTEIYDFLLFDTLRNLIMIVASKQNNHKHRNISHVIYNVNDQLSFRV